MNRAAETLSNASHKLAEAMYSKTRQAGGEAAGGANAGGSADGNGGAAGPDESSESKKEDVVDADFKEVK